MASVTRRLLYHNIVFSKVTGRLIFFNKRSALAQGILLDLRWHTKRLPGFAPKMKLDLRQEFCYVFFVTQSQTSTGRLRLSLSEDSRTIACSRGALKAFVRFRPWFGALI